MNKTLFLVGIALLLFIAGCTEKKLLSDVEGTWSVSKYLFESKDKTADFKKQKPQFKWTFNADKTFSETWNYFDSTFYATYDTTFVTDTFGNTTISAIDSTKHVNLNQKTYLKQGEWVLINSNKYLQLRDDSSSTVREYKIESHSGSSLQLFRGNEDFTLGTK